MKFAKHYLQSIEGVEIYPIISLLIFFGFFVVLFWWVFTTSKKQSQEMSEMPLEINQKDQNP